MTRKSSGGCLETGAVKVGLASVAAISFFNVSGGPWGSEDIVGTAGPALGCLGILIFTVFFCVPQCYYTAELCCAYPSNGGYAIWVREAFGDFWGVQEVYWQWVSGVADAAVYPVLLCDTILQLLGKSDLGTSQLWLCRFGLTALMSLPSAYSFHTVPQFLLVFGIFTAAPVVTFLLWGATLFQPLVLSQRKESIRWGKVLNAIFWNLEGWDCISSLSGMVAEPREKNIPRGLFLSLALASVQYTLVLLVAAGLDPQHHPWYDWSDGSFPNLVVDKMGATMTFSLLVASIFGNFGLYLSEFTEDSYLLQGVAEIGLVPRAFGRRLHSTGAPCVANLFQFIIVSVLCVFDFSDIIVFDNFFSGMAVLLEFLAFFVLRWKQPDLPRPYRVPTWALMLFVPALGFLGAMLHHCFIKSGKASLVTILAFAAGLPYGLWVAYREKRQHELGIRSALDEYLYDEGSVGPTPPLDTKQCSGASC